MTLFLGHPVYFYCQISREGGFIVMEQCQDFQQKFRLTSSDLERLIELGY